MKPATPYNRAHHLFAVATAAATFLLLMVGALVTSNDAGLAVPDWPTSFGHWPITYHYWAKTQMVGGTLYEHGHRMVAQIVGMMMIVLAVWTWRVDRRGWMRKLGFWALAGVIVQGILGGITVLFYLPPGVSTAHATLAQTFFVTVVAMAMFTGRDWLENSSLHLANTGSPRTRTLTRWAVISVYLQLILGAAFRHSAMKLLPHLIVAAVVTVMVLWTAIRVMREYPDVRALRVPAQILVGLLVAQLGLGLGAYLTRVEWGKDAAQPLAAMVWTTVAHVVVGALVLATTAMLAIQVRRHLAPARQPATASEPSSSRQAVMA